MCAFPNVDEEDSIHYLMVEPTTEVVEVGLRLSMGPTMQGKTFEIVRIDQIHEIVSPTVESLLQPLGFKFQGPLSWLRSVNAPIRQLFRLEQRKAARWRRHGLCHWTSFPIFPAMKSNGTGRQNQHDLI